VSLRSKVAITAPVLAGAVLVFAALQGPERELVLLDLPRVPQRTSQWCWAASTQMALNAVLGDEAPSLCGDEGIVANSYVLSYPGDCAPVCANCGDPADEDLRLQCVEVGWPVLQPFGISFDQTERANEKSAAAALSWTELKEQLRPGEDGRAAPVIFSWAWSGGGGHIMVASGFIEDARLEENGRLVLVQDPWPPCIGDTYLLTYEAWVGSDETGRRHWRDYWNLRVEEVPQAPPGGWQRSVLLSPMLPMLPAVEAVEPALGRPIGPPAEAVPVARAGLRILRSLGDHALTRAELGFLDSVDLERAAFTRTAIGEQRVGIDELRSWTEDQPPESLLDESGWIFPVTHLGGGAVFTAVAIEKRGEDWRLAELGGKGWVERLAYGFRAAHVQTPPWPIEECFLFSVPGLRRYYVARHTEAGGLRLIRIPNVIAAPATESQDAVTVFTELRERAAKVNAEKPG